MVGLVVDMRSVVMKCTFQHVSQIFEVKLGSHNPLATGTSTAF